MLTFKNKAEPVRILAPFVQYGANSIIELYQRYYPNVVWTYDKLFEAALSLWLILFAQNIDPPRADQLIKMRYSSTGLLIPTIRGPFYSFKMQEEALNSSGNARKGLANPSLTTILFNPDNNVDLAVRASQSSFEHHFAYTYEILDAFLLAEVQNAGVCESDFNLVQGERSTRASNIQRYHTEIKKLHKTLFGFSDPAKNKNKIVLLYSLLAFHHITWNIAFSRCDLALLHDGFIQRYKSFDLVANCETSEAHKIIIFQQGLQFLNFRCIDCFRPGGCNIWCQFCSHIGNKKTESRAATGHTVSGFPLEHLPAYNLARDRLVAANKPAIPMKQWAANQNPPVVILARVTGSSTSPDPSSSASSSHYTLSRAVNNQDAIYEHPPLPFL